MGSIAFCSPLSPKRVHYEPFFFLPFSEMPQKGFPLPPLVLFFFQKLNGLLFSRAFIQLLPDSISLLGENLGKGKTVIVDAST